MCRNVAVAAISGTCKTSMRTYRETHLLHRVDLMPRTHFPNTRPFMLVIRRWSVDSQHKGQKCDTLMVSLVLVWKLVWPHYATLIIAMAETLYGFWIWSPTWFWCNLCTMIPRHGHKCLIVTRCEMWTCFYRNHLLCFNLFDLSMTWRQKDNPN